MADDLKRVGLIFKADGAVDFKATLTSINTERTKNKNEFDRLKLTYDENTKASEKLKNQQEYLQKQYEAQTKKVKALSLELEELNNKENVSQDEIKKKQAQLDKVTLSQTKYQKSLEKVSSELKKGTPDLKGFAKEIKKTGDGVKEAGENLTSKLTTPIIAAGTAALASTEATKEYREDLGKLNTNAQNAGSSLDKTHIALKNLNAITGESDSNIEGLSNLLEAGFTDDSLLKLVDELSGAVIKFPDTLKIESLSDSIQETLATGAATGQFGELLDRLGIGADNFSKQLSKCKTEAQKQNLVIQTLSKQGLSELNKSYRENNESLIANSNAQFDLNQSMSELGETMEPIMAEITQLAADMLSWFNGLDSSTKILIGTIALLVAAIGPLIVVIGTLISSFGSITAALTPVIGAINTAGGLLPWLSTALSGLIAPVTAVIAIIAGLTATFVTLWNTSESFRTSIIEIWNNISSVMLNVYNTILKPVLDMLMIAIMDVWNDSLLPLWNNWKSFVEFIVSIMNSLLSRVQPVLNWFISTFGPLLTGVFNGLVVGIRTSIGLITNILNGLLSSAKSIINSLKQVFNGITTFVTGVFTGNWKKAWNGVVSIFKGIVNTIKSVFKAPINGCISIMNGLIDGLNTLIKGINKISFDVPDWVPGIGGKKFGFNLSRIGKIKYMQFGGELLSGTAIVGEAGAEMLQQTSRGTRVIPLTDSGGANKQDVIDYDKMAMVFINALSRLDLKLILDDRVFGRMMKERYGI